MKKLTMFILISILPIYSFADHFWVSTHLGVDDDIIILEKKGWIIKEIQAVVRNLDHTDYIIQYGVE